MLGPCCDASQTPTFALRRSATRAATVLDELHGHRCSSVRVSTYERGVRLNAVRQPNPFAAGGFGVIVQLRPPLLTQQVALDMEAGAQLLEWDCRGRASHSLTFCGGALQHYPDASLTRIVHSSALWNPITAR